MNLRSNLFPISSSIALRSPYNRYVPECLKICQNKRYITDIQKFATGFFSNDLIHRLQLSLRQVHVCRLKGSISRKEYVFSTCGAVGRLGPNEEQCSNAYLNTSTQITVLTDPTMEGIQKWEVPESGLYT
ncbi:hypothetical protein AVEN_83087-1 [Araneus ventricosus]|uniref:Uncharacterized protein n=1 Tax=Araneus ventricosus TaxID=182803 RepID=A0A4Y2ANB6_ARAVE|nr:hypothetical protein AVEN_83087-1 [Araneus ventricosus]